MAREKRAMQWIPRVFTQLEIQPCDVTIHYAKANGKAESSVKTVKQLFKKAERDGKDPWLVLLDYRNIPTEGLRTSPAQRLMSRRTRTLLPTAVSLLRPEIIPDSTRQLEWKRRKASFTMTVLQNCCLNWRLDTTSELHPCRRIKRGSKLLA